MTLPLFQHQSEALAFCEVHPRGYLNICMGGGKTRVMLELIKRKKAKALVIAPLTLIETSWRGDWERFGYSDDMCFANMHLDKKKKWLMASYEKPCNEDKANLHIINPEAFIKVASALSMSLACWYDTLIIDEASKLKNRTTAISKAVFEMSKRVKSVYLLSGNPCPNNVDEWWAQLRCIDPTLLGESYYGFMNKYFYATVGYAPGQRQFKRWTPYPERLPKLMEQVSKVTFRVTKEEALDLPPQTFVVRSIELEPEQRRLYETLKKEWIITHGNATVVAANALAELSKLRQISSGFVIHAGGILTLGDAKRQALLETLDEIGNEQVVIFSCWREEIRQIKEALGEKAGCVYGEATETEKTEAIKAFQAGNIQYLIVHPASGGFGLNLANASYCVWASLSYSAEHHEQGNARIHRSGQTHPCTYIYLLARDTVDIDVHKAILKKEDVSRKLLEMLAA